MSHTKVHRHIRKTKHGKVIVKKHNRKVNRMGYRKELTKIQKELPNYNYDEYDLVPPRTPLVSDWAHNFALAGYIRNKLEKRRKHSREDDEYED